MNDLLGFRHPGRPSRTVLMLAAAAFTVVLVGTIVTVIVSTGGLSAPDERVVYPGITSLEIDTDHGDVEVIGSDTTEVRVSRIRTGKGPTLETWSGSSLQLGYACVDVSTCQVISDSETDHTDYSVVVPRALTVTISSKNGDITVRDVTGEVKAHTDRGALTRTPPSTLRTPA
ncbi:hypothetical protein [Actinocorallia longicatena]